MEWCDFAFHRMWPISVLCFLGFCPILQRDSSPRACEIAAGLTKLQPFKRRLKWRPIDASGRHPGSSSDFIHMPPHRCHSLAQVRNCHHGQPSHDWYVSYRPLYGGKSQCMALMSSWEPNCPIAAPGAMAASIEPRIKIRALYAVGKRGQCSFYPCYGLLPGRN